MLQFDKWAALILTTFTKMNTTFDSDHELRWVKRYLKSKRVSFSMIQVAR